MKCKCKFYLGSSWSPCKFYFIFVEVEIVVVVKCEGDSSTVASLLGSIRVWMVKKFIG